MLILLPHTTSLSTICQNFSSQKLRSALDVDGALLVSRMFWQLTSSLTAILSTDISSTGFVNSSQIS